MPKSVRKLFLEKFKNFIHFFQDLLKLLQNILNEKQFLYLSCILVSISSAAAVIVLKTFAHKVLQISSSINALLKLPYANSIFPVIGILLTIVVVQKFLNGSIQKGTSQIMIAVAQKSGIMPKKQMYSQIITSSLTVGMGGSAGLESPITITGAAFGSNYAQYYHFNYKNRTLLLACGVASGIATAFNAPIAGVLFAIEVVLADMSVTAFIPLLLSSATGSIIGNLVFGDQILLSFKNQLGFDYHNTFYYILLGVLGGLVSIYHARMFRKVEHHISHRYKNPYMKGIFGASLLALLIFIFPTLFGEGYESILFLANDESNQLVNNSLLESFSDHPWVLLFIVVCIMLVKSIATGLTLGSGGNGGNFAPSLFVGSYLGFVVSKFFQLLGFQDIPLQNFTVVGMAALLSGLFHAPLTAIFLIAEITSGYGLIVPLMIVSSISFAISRRFDKYSMDIYAVADQGIVFTSDKDSNLLNKIDVFNTYQSDIKTLKEGCTFDEVAHLFQENEQLFIPILNADDEVVGEIRWNDFKHHNAESFTPTIIRSVKTFSIFNAARTILNHMNDQNEHYVLLTKENKYAGYLSKEYLMDHYRKNLKQLRIE